MRCDPVCKTKEELIRRVQAGEGMYAYDPQSYLLVPAEGETVIYGPAAWTAKVHLQDGQIVKVLE